MSPIVKIYRFTKWFVWRTLLFVLCLLMGMQLGLWVITYQDSPPKKK